MAARNFARFLQHTQGTVAPLFAIAAIPLMVAVGAVVDYNNAYDQRTILQDSMDSAALAAGKKIGLLTMDQLKTDVDHYYYTNVGTRLANPPPLAVSLQASTITLTTDLVVPTYFLGLIGLNHLDFHVTSEATLALGTLEVAIVLDNSGSMNTNNNIAALRTAAGNLATTLWGLGATSTKPEPVKISLVPFAAAVNVDPAMETSAGATWLDKNGIGTYTADIIDGAATTANPFTLFAGLKDSAGNNVTWGGCVEARPIPYDVTDDAASPATPATMFAPMFAADDPDHWTCTSSTCTGAGKVVGSGSTLRYNAAPTGAQNLNNYLPDVGNPKACGSIVTITQANPAVVTLNNHHLAAGDQVVFNTTGALYTGITSGTTYYVLSSGLTANTFRISTTSGGTAVATSGTQSGIHTIMTSAQWTCANNSAACGGTGNGVNEASALASTCKYGTAANKSTVSSITVGGIPGGPNFMCTSSKLTPLTTNQTTISNAINGMVALGATNILEGLMWGLRTLSPGAPFTEGRAYAAGDNQKILIFMTDGENTYYPNNKAIQGTWYGAWGYIAKNHLGTTSTTQSVEQTEMNNRTAIACANVKSVGIKVYTVAFTGSGGINAATQTMLQNCASDSSMYFLAADQTALINAFIAIGDQITLLRISQ